MFCTIVLQTTFVSYSGGNHLSTDPYRSVLLLVHFLRESAPTIIWVSRSWGLPRSTPAISARLRHCGTFKVFMPYPERT